MLGYNIVQFGTEFFVLNQSIGEVHVTDGAQALIERHGNKQVMVADTIEEARTCIRRACGLDAGHQRMISNETNVPVSSARASLGRKARQSLPTGAVSHNHDTLAVNVAIGNHRCIHGIGEILYTLKAFFSRLSRSYKVTYSVDLKPGCTNLLIDEFSLLETIGFLQEFKKAHPGTKFVIVATEFITPIRLFGLQLAETFNYFDPWEDLEYGSAVIAHRLGLRRTLPYMYARYLGFSEALRLADLVVAVHPAIVEALMPLKPEMDHWVAPPLNLYPEINPEQIALNPHLKEWQAGFVMTGTQTPFRRQIIKELLMSVGIVGIQGQVVQHLPFDRTEAFALHNGSIDFPFEKLGVQSSEEKKPESHDDKARSEPNYLFNLNPPQRANWPYSSPMRILRAVLYGQIPVITRRFGDHEIETIAKLWKPEIANAGVVRELWIEATLGRGDLIKHHIAAISEYNKIAKQKNIAVDLALQAL